MQHTVADLFLLGQPSRPAGKHRVPQSAAARIALSLLVVLALTLPFASLATAAPTDSQIKAVFLYNFTRFIEWPATAFSRPDGDLVIGILGEDPFGADLDRVISGETQDRHAVKVVRYKSVDDIDYCHILFISASERSKLSAILKKLNGRSVLTVADDEGLANRGVMINLITTDNRIKMDINLKAAHAAGLTLSSKLLRAATVVDAGTRR